MSGENNKKRFSGTFLEIAITAAFGALSALPLGGLVVAYPLYRVLITIVLGIICSIYLHMLIHELGHMIFGNLSGYEFLMFRIGSLALVRSEKQVVVRRVKSLGAGGQCLMTPPEGVGYNCPYVLYNFGGSLLNLMLAMICSPVYFFWRSIPGAVIYIFGAAGAFMFITNWIPLRIGGIPNDGYNSLTCSRSREARNAFCLTLRITGRLYEGVRLRDMDSSWFDFGESAGKDHLTASHICLSASRYMDMGDMDSARKLFEKAVGLPAIDEINRNEASCELLFLASLEGSQQASEFYTKDLEKYFRTANDSPAVKRCALAWALMNGADTAELNSLKKSWRECVNKYAVGAASAMEEYLMDILEKKYSDPV